jgi:creatinine amidohydrolase/Fe(II)-dependent formamide hydrolase-like protein
MTVAQVAATLADDPRLIVPVGTCERWHPALPLGTATIIAEHLADDLSSEYGILRAPTIEYGVNQETKSGYAGRVALRKKTLHRTLNDMLASWETNGISEFILLTIHGYDPHQEALDTLTTASARIRVVDPFAVNLVDLIGNRRSTDDRGPLFLALMRHLAPQCVTDPDADPTHSAALGAALYERIRERISERIFLAPSPIE